RFHFDNHGHHSKPHRRVCDEPDRRRDENRQDGARDDAPEADFSQRASEDNLGRDGGRGNERDEPQPLDPSIVDRYLSQMEQPMIPFRDAVHHRHEPVPLLPYMMISGWVSRPSSAPKRLSAPRS